MISKAEQEMEIHPRAGPGYEHWGVSVGSYSLFASWIVSVYHGLIHGQIWISTYFAHTWPLTQLPELSSLFTPLWFFQPSSAWWRVPRVWRVWSGSNPWVLQPRTFLAFLCQPTRCDYCSQAVGSDWVTALHRGGWVSQPGQKFHCMKKEDKYFGKWH